MTSWTTLLAARTARCLAAVTGAHGADLVPRIDLVIYNGLIVLLATLSSLVHDLTCIDNGDRPSLAGGPRRVVNVFRRTAHYLVQVHVMGCGPSAGASPVNPGLHGVGDCSPSLDGVSFSCELKERWRACADAPRRTDSNGRAEIEEPARPTEQAVSAALHGRGRDPPAGAFQWTSASTELVHVPACRGAADLDVRQVDCELGTTDAGRSQLMLRNVDTGCYCRVFRDAAYALRSACTRTSVTTL